MPSRKNSALVQRFRISDELWERLDPLLPRPRRVAKWRGGRPRLDPRVVADAIFFVLRTGCQWNALSTEAHGCSGSSAHRYFQQWVRRRIFHRLWQAGLQEYDEVSGIEWDYTPHVRSRGEEKVDLQEIPGYRARRWVVERTHSWMNRFRRLLIRWEKKVENYLALSHFACAIIAFRGAGVIA